MLSRAFRINPGDFLLSHTVSRAVPSAPTGLTSVFGMGTGVTLSTKSPENLLEISNCRSQISDENKSYELNLFKDPEDEASQLNRLDISLSSEFAARSYALLRRFRRRPVISLASQS